MLTGNIVDIKHLAVHDGPGIRTTLFFKGCPLRCRWCHNPESQAVKKELALLQKQCINCRECAKVCDLHTFENNIHTIDRNSCTACGKCVAACPVNALEIYGKLITVEAALQELAADRVFYQNSGGGCTLSGGEPLLQSEFSSKLLCELKKLQIHTAVDTCGAVPWSAFEKVLPYTDLFLFDLKHPETGPHKTFTQLGNEELLANLFKLDAAGKFIEIRIPLIPDFNSDVNTLEKFACILSKLSNITSVKVLPFHRARFKYQALGLEERLSDTPVCSTELLQKVKTFFSNKNINVSEN